MHGEDFLIHFHKSYILLRIFNKSSPKMIKSTYIDSKYLARNRFSFSILPTMAPCVTGSTCSKAYDSWVLKMTAHIFWGVRISLRACAICSGRCEYCTVEKKIRRAPVELGAWPTGGAFALSGLALLLTLLLVIRTWLAFLVLGRCITIPLPCVTSRRVTLHALCLTALEGRVPASGPSYLCIGPDPQQSTPML